MPWRELTLDLARDSTHGIQRAAVSDGRGERWVVDQEHDGAPWIVLKRGGEKGLANDLQILLVRRYKDGHSRRTARRTEVIEIGVGRAAMRGDALAVHVTRKQVNQAAVHEPRDEPEEHGAFGNPAIVRILDGIPDQTEIVESCRPPSGERYRDTKRGDERRLQDRSAARHAARTINVYAKVRIPLSGHLRRALCDTSTPRVPGCPLRVTQAELCGFFVISAATAHGSHTTIRRGGRVRSHAAMEAVVADELIEFGGKGHRGTKRIHRYRSEANPASSKTRG